MAMRDIDRLAQLVADGASLSAAARRLNMSARVANSLWRQIVAGLGWLGD